MTSVQPKVTEVYLTGQEDNSLGTGGPGQATSYTTYFRIGDILSSKRMT